MMGVSTEVLTERPWRAIWRAMYHAFQRFCDTSDVHALSNAENTAGATDTSAAAIRSGRNSELPKASRSFPNREEASCQVPNTNPANSTTRSHVMPLRG